MASRRQPLSRYGVSPEFVEDSVDDDDNDNELPPPHMAFTGPRLARKTSPLLEQRRRSMSNAQRDHSSPVIIQLGDRSAHPLDGRQYPFEPLAHTQMPPPPPPPPALAAPTIAVDPATIPILPSTLKAGPTMPVAEFCEQHDVGEHLCALLFENGYRKTNTFPFITVPNLIKMGFKDGDIATFQVAVRAWGVPVRQD
ncbi:hypothetical protein ONZ45_g14618 [Pleurotus djamor]|nr:hypothetical protein ONZ45_g14618 [Pleurotus djamor]